MEIYASPQTMSKAKNEKSYNLFLFFKKKEAYGSVCNLYGPLVNVIEVEC